MAKPASFQLTPDAPRTSAEEVDLHAPRNYVNRELSWLAFARRVLAQVADPELPLLERVKFAGIMGMLHDEFFMKRMAGLKRQIANGVIKRSIDGKTPSEELEACRKEVTEQVQELDRVMGDEIRPALAAEGIPIRDIEDLDAVRRRHLRHYFERSVQPILTPLAVDAEHPFPFISNLGLNLAVILPEDSDAGERFVRIKVPGNRPRWVPLPEDGGFCPLEQVIADNLDLLFRDTPPRHIHLFRVTRGAEGHRDLSDEEDLRQPGSIVDVVRHELKARRFAGVVRLEVAADTPEALRSWLADELGVEAEDVYLVREFLGLADFASFEVADREDLRYPPHEPVTHPRLVALPPNEPAAIFEEIARRDILLHHPYQSFDTSVLRFIESAAVDPSVLAIKLTIYRTSSDSPIVRALAEASRRGKQVAVLVEITARFDEAPNIAWGRFLEQEGVHVAYGVERLKTHVKLALVVREEAAGLRRYAHVGTGNYHTRTARLYEDLGVLTCDPAICDDVSRVFNALTGASSFGAIRGLLVAPTTMRKRFQELIRREVAHAEAGQPCGIQGKMNQLQDPEMIRELYRASRAGVPVRLFVRGLCCLRAGVPGLSENIRVASVVGRFLEHSRIYAFTNGGDPELFIGSADWMKRNLDQRVETILPIRDPEVRRELQEILVVCEEDNYSAWYALPDGSYRRSAPGEGEEQRVAQEVFIERARGQVETDPSC